MNMRYMTFGAMIFTASIAALSGCGKSGGSTANTNLALQNLETSGTAVTTPVSCQAGGRNFGGYCITAAASDLQGTCLQVNSAAQMAGTGFAGLTYTTESGNAQVCMVTSRFPAQMSVLGYVPRVSGGRGMAPTGLLLHAKDRFAWSGGTGGYGWADGKWSTTGDCHRINLNGIQKSDGQMASYNGREGGLYATEGNGTLFKMGTAGSHDITADGMISMGYNAPSDGDWSDAKACDDGAVLLTISHCEDSSGVTRKCP